MTKRLIISEVLENLNDIAMEFSDVEDDELYDSDQENENEVCGTQEEIFESENRDNELLDEENIQDSSESDSEFENSLNSRKRRCMQVRSSSEDESESIRQDNQNEISADGTCWEKMQEGSCPKRLALHNIFKDVSGPTGYA
ncbi:DNA polymerase epsilon subunit 2-like [Bactrocera neohumeralis]|uniref:DNA polymerase epsilon subunit 2-like n=1 Tax=Bactrocera tryoni TaxID=59916 RepID=UPI001A96B144|nr:DNA polymerase epsilon subunit 2-like [Bactrocera tryoni]XP_050338239.1 DNA polymerase epsilon subunit 2-like [Bactrocera neohumeralis]